MACYARAQNWDVHPQTLRLDRSSRGLPSLVLKSFTAITQEEVALDCSKQLQGSRAGTCSLEVFPSLIAATMTQQSTNPHCRFLCLVCIVKLARSSSHSYGVESKCTAMHLQRMKSFVMTFGFADLNCGHRESLAETVGYLQIFETNKQ